MDEHRMNWSDGELCSLPVVFGWIAGAVGCVRSSVRTEVS